MYSTSRTAQLLREIKENEGCTNFDGMIPPVCLSIDSDTTFLDPLHNFLRTECIEIFVATQHDIDAPGRGSKPSCIGQLGLRCIYCKDMSRK